MKSIILYYSRSGNTEKLAKRIKSDLNCDMLKIEPEEKYGSYIASLLRVMKENSNKIPPKFITPVPDLSSYDIILIGFPTWEHDLPAFVLEFINQCDLRGKIVIPFTTFGIGGINWSKKTLEKACQGAEIKLRFNYGMLKKDDYDKWINAVGKS